MIVLDVIIRDYEEQDLDGVNLILSDAFSVQKESFLDSNFHEIVAVCDNQVIGYLLLTKVLNPIRKQHYYLVDYVCVSSEYRNKGVGKDLLDYAYFIAKNDKALYLQLTCSRFRLAAHKLYEKCNFVKRDSDIFRKEIV